MEKGIAQAWEIQRRLRVWRPRRAAVMGAGTIGLLAALALRLRGLEVTVFGRTAKPYLNSDLVDALGAQYVSTVDVPILDGASREFVLGNKVMVGTVNANREYLETGSGTWLTLRPSTPAGSSGC